MPVIDLLQRQNEYIKCATDPDYFMNNYGYVFNAKKKKVLKMSCFDYQNDCLYKFHKHRNNIILKSRQTGLSVITAGYVAWRLIFRKDEKILIIANDGRGAVRFLSTVKQFIDFTPMWLLPGDGSRITNNTKEVRLANNSFAVAQASSPEAGRGDSLTLLVLDETAFIENADTIWMAAGLALSATEGKCIMLSTPNGTSNLYHDTWTEADRKDKNFDKDDFVPTKVHWTENPFSAEGLELREDESGEKVYWSPWYESECKRMHYDKVKISQELDLSFEGSKYLAIENDLINKYDKRFLLEEYKLIDKNKTFYDYRNKLGERFVRHETLFKIFKPYIKGHNYILGVDVARGDGKDYSTIEIIDIEELEVVAEYRDKVAPDLLAHVIYNVAMDYGTAYVVVECNNHGLATAIDLSRKMNYPRMFYSKAISEIFARPYDYKINENEIIPGFQTTKKSRPLLINNLRIHLRDGALKFYSKQLMGEFKTFIQNGDKAEAEKGKHDDLIMALAIALFIRDTEYQNVTATKEMYKGMIESIGIVVKTIDGQEFSTSSGNYEESKNELNVQGIFFNNFSNKEESYEIDDSDDIGWLLSPLKKNN
jgi:hypothetical protein